MLNVLANVLFALQQPATPEGFVPVTGGPQVEQIPAAPLVIASYAFFLLLMVFYLWTIWRRIGKVEAEMQALDRRQSGGSK
jgi:hypothetical protein